MYITLRKGVVRGRPFLVRIHLNDQGRNRMFEVERATLRCTCDQFIADDHCRHVKECGTELQQWKTRQLRKLRRESFGNATISELAAQLEKKLPRPLAAATIIPLADGLFALQWHADPAERQASGCGWGTGGDLAVLLQDHEDLALLQLLSREPDSLLWQWEIERLRLLPVPAAPLPPRMLRAPGGSAADSSGSGRGMFDLIRAEQERDVPRPAEARQWARFWAACAGLHLEDQSWTGAGRYLPGWQIGGEAVVALAFDLRDLRVRGLTQAMLRTLREGIPDRFRAHSAHVQLAWLEAEGEDPAYQLVVCNANEQAIRPGSNLTALTTNFWNRSEEPYPEVHALLAQAAECLVRLGHDPDVSLYHGDAHWPLHALAEMAAVSDSSPAWDVTPAGWRLAEQQIHACLNVPGTVTEGWGEALQNEHGRKLIPPC